MGFLNLKEFKEELSQAVNELVEDNPEVAPEELAAGVQKEDVIIPEIANKENAAETVADTENVTVAQEQPESLFSNMEEEDFESNIDMKALSELFGNETSVAEEKNKSSKKSKNKKASKDVVKEAKETVEEVVKAAEAAEQEAREMKRLEEEVRNVDEVKNNMMAMAETGSSSEDTAEITRGMVIEGNVSSDGSINVNGKVKGNIQCNGKLVISGTVVGVSSASEIYTTNAKINGDVQSAGSVKVGNSSIIIGNVYGTSAVVGGAVKGDLDIRGPVIVDGTAVIQGNIKSRSVQINNGAVIEGIISQCYADVDYDALFDKTFSE